MTAVTTTDTCIPAADIRPLANDALASISGAIAREKSRVATIGLLRAQSDVKKLLALLPSDTGL